MSSDSISGLFSSSRGAIRPCYLRLMSPTTLQTVHPASLWENWGTKWAAWKILRKEDSHGRSAREDARPPHAARPHPSRRHRPRQPPYRLREGPPHRRGRLAGALLARHGRRAPRDRRQAFPDTNRGGRESERRLRDDRAEPGEGARRPGTRPEHTAAARPQARNLRLLRLPCPRVAAPDRLDRTPQTSRGPAFCWASVEVAEAGFEPATFGS